MNTIKNVFFLALVTLLGCNLNSSKTWKNDGIQNDLREEIHALNRQVVRAFVDNAPEQMLSIAGDALIEITTKEELQTIVSQVHQALIDDSATIVDEYYSANSVTGGNTLLLGDGYKLSYVAHNEESYVALIELKVRPNTRLMMGLIYGKYDEGWKLNICQIGEYKYHDLTATDFLAKSKEQYAKGHFIDAANNVFLAQKLANPVKNIFIYNEKEEIENSLNQLRSELGNKYSFPLEIATITSKPALLSFSPQLLNEGVIPVVDYQSNVPFQDTVALKTEYLEVAQFINEEFKGLMQENELIIFKAFEEIPDGKTPINTYTFIHKTE